MLFQAPSLGIYIRIVALITLFIGLSDAARLLGISLGNTSPIGALGVTGFIHLAVFALNRLLAAVGLWLKASWGMVLLVGTTIIELAVYGLDTAHIQISPLSFAMRAVLLLAVLVIFALSIRFTRAQAE